MRKTFGRKIAVMVELPATFFVIIHGNYVLSLCFNCEKKGKKAFETMYKQMMKEVARFLCTEMKHTGTIFYFLKLWQQFSMRATSSKANCCNLNWHNLHDDMPYRCPLFFVMYYF